MCRRRARNYFICTDCFGFAAPEQQAEPAPVRVTALSKPTVRLGQPLEAVVKSQVHKTDGPKGGDEEPQDKIIEVTAAVAKPGESAIYQAGLLISESTAREVECDEVAECVEGHHD